MNGNPTMLLLRPALLSLGLLLPLTAQGPQLPPALNAGAAIGTSVDGDDVIGIGPRYTLRAHADAVTYVPMLGERAPRSLPLSLRLLDCRHGGVPLALTPPVRSHTRLAIDYARGVVTERYALSAEGVEQTFTFAERPAGRGDLVVRLAVTSAVAGRASSDGGIDFVAGDCGVRYGALTGVDAMGRKQPGTVRLAGDVLELSLPAAFVDAAAFPLTFDPLLGTAALANTSADDGEPDACFANTPARHLVVWRRVVAFGESNLVGQLIDTSPAASTPFLIDAIAGSDVHSGRVAFCPLRTAFLVVWQRTVGPFGTSPTLLARSVPANGGAMSPQLTITNTAGQVVVSNAHGPSADMPVVWVVPNGAIKSQTVTLTGASAISLIGSQHGLASTTIAGARVAISRTGGLGGTPRHFVVWNGDTTDPLQVRAVCLGVQSTPLAGVVSVTSGGSQRRRPAVDGDGANFLVTWDTSSALVAQTCVVSAGVGAVTVTGSPTTVATAAADVLRNGDLVRAGGSFLMSWLQENTLFDTQAKALVLTSTATAIGPPMDLVGPARAGGYDRQSAPRLAARGAITPGDDTVLAVFEEGQAALPFDRDVVLQFLEVMGQGGPVVTLAQSCGVGGITGVNGPCALGNANFAFTMTNADQTAPLVLLSLALNATPVPCGPCSLLPPLVLETLTPNLGTASRLLPIPTQLSVLGATLQAQWLPAFGVPGPCSLFPFVSTTTVIQATIGL